MSIDLAKYHNAISEAAEEIKGYIRKTPLELSPVLSEKTGANVFLKLEIEQTTGSFKVRGASNKLRKFCNKDGCQEKENGVITASSGNHGVAISYIGSKLGIKPTVYVPVNVPQTKVNLLNIYGADIGKHGRDCYNAEKKAKEVAKSNGLYYISPYNDFDVICGHGTIGCEIYEDLSEVDAVFVPVGGGSLISGIATYLKAVRPSVQIIGVQPETNHVMTTCIKAGKLMEIDDLGYTISDGTEGGVEHNSITFDICQSYVDKWVLVSEEEIEKAIYFMLEHHHKVIEGAAALPISALLKCAEEFKNKNVVLIMSGANIAIELFKDIVNKYA